MPHANLLDYKPRNEKKKRIELWRDIPERTGSRNQASWGQNRHRELCPQLSQKEHRGEAELQLKIQQPRKSSPKPWMHAQREL